MPKQNSRSLAFREQEPRLHFEEAVALMMGLPRNSHYRPRPLILIVGGQLRDIEDRDGYWDDSS